MPTGQGKQGQPSSMNKRRLKSTDALINSSRLTERYCIAIQQLFNESAAKRRRLPDVRFDLTEEQSLSPLLSLNTPIGQSRPGTHHGKGGRRAGSSLFIRTNFQSLISASLCRQLMEHVSYSPSAKEEFCKFLCPEDLKNLADAAACQPLENITVIKNSLLGICTYFPSTEAPSLDASSTMTATAKMRHVICTWLSEDGTVRCSCVGRSSFSSWAYSTSERPTIAVCPHSSAVTEILENIFPMSNADVAKLIISSTAYQAPPYLSAFSVAGGKAVVVVGEECGTAWIPVRRNLRGPMPLRCAFCDLSPTSTCVHSQTARELQDVTVASAFTDTITETQFVRRLRSVSSFLPLSIVNCRNSIASDASIWDDAKKGDFFRLKVPSHCPICKMPAGNMVASADGGTVMTTMGPGKLLTERRKCINSDCEQELINAEGRSDFVVILSATSAATHCFVRRITTGLAKSNGTLTGRIEEHLAECHSRIWAGIFPKTHDNISRSLSILREICNLALRLMVIKLSPKLFSCHSCFQQGNVVPSTAVCIDGIWVGHQRSEKQKPFSLISSPCKPIQQASGASRFPSRPRSSLIRLEAAAKRLVSAIRGKKRSLVTEKTLDSALAAIRLVSGNALPDSFISKSVCGGAPRHIYHDMGEKSNLSHIRQLLGSFFDQNVLLGRLCGDVLPFARKKIARLGSGAKQLTDYVSLKENLEYAIDGGLQTEASLEDFDNVVPVCWNSIFHSFSSIHRQGTPLRDKFDSDRSCALSLILSLLQGPLSQVFTGSHQSTHVINALTSAISDPARLTRVQSLQMNQLIYGGFFGVKQLSSTLNYQTLLDSFIQFLLDAASCARDFFKFYSETQNAKENSAMKFASDWGVQGTSLMLRSKFCQKFPRASTDSEDVFSTGFFFPTLPQIRPLPFADPPLRKSENATEDYGICSKNYSNKNNTFTPGALTFCCSCTNPIVVGFRVLESQESPRAVLDTLVSRFATFPRFVVYDHGCGAFYTAQHTVPWVIQHTTFVSDSFHVVNHTCSDTFRPSCYPQLNARNSVSHEQRNRPIAELKRSLRQCGRDNYISMLAYHIAYLNLIAIARGETRRRDPSSTFNIRNLTQFHADYIGCLCCSE